MKFPQKNKVYLPILLLSVVIIFSGCSYIFPVEEDNLKPPVVQATKIDYSTTKVVKGDIQSTYEGTLKVESNSFANLAFKSRSGYLTYINNSIGASVKKGDVIAKLDTASIETELESTEIELKKSQIRYDEMIKKAESTAQVDLDIAKLKLEKQREDYNNLVNSSSDSYEVELARLNLIRAENEYFTLKETGGTNSAEIQIAAENLKQLKAKITKLKTELSKCTLISPVTGVITQSLNLSVGDLVSTNAIIAKIEESGKYNLTLTDNYPNLSSYENVTVTYKEKEYKGKFISADDSNSEEASVPKYIFKSNTPIEDLAFSSSAKFKIILEEKEDVLLIPANIIQYLNDNQTTVSVYVNGIKEERGIIIGIRSSTQAEVVEGLNEGDEVIIN